MSEMTDGTQNTQPPDPFAGLLALVRDMNGDNRKAVEAIQDMQGRIRSLEEANKTLLPIVQKQQTLLEEYVNRPTTVAGVTTYFIDIMTRSSRDRTLFLLGIIAFLLFWSNIMSQFLLGTPELHQVVVTVIGKLLPSLLTQ